MSAVRYSVEIQYKKDGWERPEDSAQDEELVFELGRYCPLPGVGDCVIYKAGGVNNMHRVIYRNFGYTHLPDDTVSCIVNLIVTDVSDEEMNGRLKSRAPE
jgi:hypothetical protein